MQHVQLILALLCSKRAKFKALALSLSGVSENTLPAARSFRHKWTVALHTYHQLVTLEMKELLFIHLPKGHFLQLLFSYVQ